LQPDAARIDTERVRARLLDELVDQHVRRWELENRRPAARRPCLALSRLPHSGAEELGARVAKELGYDYFDIELVDYIAREQHVQRRLLEALDERVRSAVERYVIDAFRTAAFTESDYLRCVVRAVTAIGERGGAVILGRGAPYVLRAGDNLRVLVVAEVDVRAERLARAEGLGAAEARRELTRLDAERRAFLSQFGVDPDAAGLYDLVVNTGTLGLDAATRLVLAALEPLRGAALPR
jgi:cytidylate kinase